MSFSTFRPFQPEFHHAPNYSTIDTPSISRSVESNENINDLARFAQPRSPHPPAVLLVPSDPLWLLPCAQFASWCRRMRRSVGLRKNGGRELRHRARLRKIESLGGRRHTAYWVAPGDPYAFAAYRLPYVRPTTYHLPTSGTRAARDRSAPSKCGRRASSAAGPARQRRQR